MSYPSQEEQIQIKKFLQDSKHSSFQMGAIKWGSSFSQVKQTLPHSNYTSIFNFFIKQQTKSYLFLNTTKTLFYTPRVPTLVHKVPRENRTVCFYSDPNYNNDYSLIEEEFPFPKKDVGPQNRFMGDPNEFSM